jgi:hypothetical protein
VWPYPKAPDRRETVRGRKTGRSQILTETTAKDQVEAESSEKLKTVRCEDSLSKKENLHKGNTRKTLFEKDSDTSSKDISAEDFNTCSKNYSSLWKTLRKMLTT